jgi:hypothetical protein
MIEYLFSVIALFAVFSSGCSSHEPLELSGTVQTTQSSAPHTDQEVIARAVGSASAGSRPLAWANPATGSAGAIQQIDIDRDVEDGCRNFTTSRQSIAGTTRFDGVACPAGPSWKLSGSDG